METKFNFKSQICTSKSQSETLLKLGLKKETADMSYKVTTHDFKGNEINEKDRHYTLCCWYDESSLVCGLERKETIPAWSLHRLWELIPKVVLKNPALHLTMCSDSIFYCTEDNNEDYEKPFSAKLNLYDNIIDSIEWLIKEGYFPKEYLV